MKYPVWLEILMQLIWLGSSISNPSLSPQLLHKLISGQDPVPPGVLIYQPGVINALETLSVLTDGESQKEFNGLYVRPLPRISQRLWLNHTNTLLLKDGTEVLDSGKRAIANLANLELIDFTYPRRSLFKFNEFLKDTHQSSYFSSILQRRKLKWDTQLISVSTATMSAQWIQSFYPKFSKLRVFHSQVDEHGGNRKVAVESMIVEGNFLYDEFDGLKLLHLPLKENSTLLVLLSPEVRDKNSYELPNRYNPLELLKRGKLATVLVQLPKFEFEYRTELVPTALNGMGLRRVHGKDADFSKLTPSKIRLSSMVHATSIRIDEFGINEEPFEPKLVSPVRIGPSLRVFYANRPFYFSIVNKNQVLFTGEFLGP
ncbi:intracellular coagulation inhibitor 2-like isoform X2 [Drosophila biarmipes]|uniref:intracellular coagulation inhibitor 2-like isoform X2 n=1 Tax=Drosophila biarmipes TaxID=125945 RepID=UPI0007E814D4|nr:intracellular coagulation inhibitor 2-like isoform X2 [Drosophila biarmipes]